jgi:thymidylate synthase
MVMSSIKPTDVAEYSCLDDLMYDVLEHLLSTGDRFKATKGDGNEMLGVSLRLLNPRARLSRSATRGKLFSALGEMFWYLSGSDRLDFILHYIRDYADASDDGITVHGAYGPRLLNSRAGNQILNIISLLKSKPTSRRAVIQLFSADDLSRDYADIPCTCTVQAVVRKEMLNFIVYMRSNDAYLGLPHDVFAFTMLQEMIARALGVEVGYYHHMVGNLHLYDDHFPSAREYIGEKFQTIEPMPAMPQGDPWPFLPALLRAEAAVRADPRASLDSELDPYWEDIIRLLRVHSEKHHKKHDYEERVRMLRSLMQSGTYGVYFPEL